MNILSKESFCYNYLNVKATFLLEYMVIEQYNIVQQMFTTA